MLIYSAGLRIGELLNLKIHDIDSDRMQIRIEQGKGQKDRYSILSEKVDDPVRTVEVMNIFDFDREIYGDTIQVRFIDRIRGEKKFSGIEELKVQLGADREKSLEVLG